MISQASLDSLSDILDLESSCFVRYLQEVAELRSSADGDDDVQALFAELYEESSAGLVDLSALLMDHAAVFPQVTWEMENARFNFLRPVFLLAPVVDSIRGELEKLEELAGGLAESGWEEAQRVVESLKDKKSKALIRVENLAQKLGETKSDPPERSGSSASRW